MYSHIGNTFFYVFITYVLGGEQYMYLQIQAIQNN